MPREISLFGLLLPSLLPILIGCVVVFIALDLVLSRWDLYRHVWHPALFRGALLLALFSAAGLLLQH